MMSQDTKVFPSDNSWLSKFQEKIPWYGTCSNWKLIKTKDRKQDLKTIIWKYMTRDYLLEYLNKYINE